MSNKTSLDETLDNLRTMAKKKVEDIARRTNNNPVMLLGVALGELYALEYTLEVLLKTLDNITKKQD